jgi:hypothetical protein
MSAIDRPENRNHDTIKRMLFINSTVLRTTLQHTTSLIQQLDEGTPVYPISLPSIKAVCSLLDRLCESHLRRQCIAHIDITAEQVRNMPTRSIERTTLIYHLCDAARDPSSLYKLPEWMLDVIRSACETDCPPGSRYTANECWACLRTIEHEHDACGIGAYFPTPHPQTFLVLCGPCGDVIRVSEAPWTKKPVPLPLCLPSHSELTLREWLGHLTDVLHMCDGTYKKAEGSTKRFCYPMLQRDGGGFRPDVFLNIMMEIKQGLLRSIV